MKLCEECKHNAVDMSFGNTGLCYECYGKMFIKEDTVLQVNKAPEVMFKISENNNEIIKITNNGDFYYQGRLITNDKEVYEGFRDFLSGQGLIFDPNKEKIEIAKKCHIGSQAFLCGAWLISMFSVVSWSDALLMSLATLFVGGMTYYGYKQQVKNYK